MTRPSLSVVIPTHNTRELTLRCLASLGAGGVRPKDVVVVDDASEDGTAEAVRVGAVDAEVVETGDNVGFSRAANLGVDRTIGDLVLVLNSDTEVLEGSLAALVAAFADDQRLGIGGAELFDPEGRPQWRAGRRPTAAWLFAQASGLGAALARLPGRSAIGPSGASRLGDSDWVSGAAMAVRRAVWSSCGPFDVGYRFYCQDLDLCTAARRAGWRVSVVGGFSVLHHHAATIAASPGSTAAFHPAHLWSDLVRFTAKTDGPKAAARAATALRLGARLRLTGRALVRPLAVDPVAWKRDTDAYRHGLAAISVVPDGSIADTA